jgi:hypothetical protein
VGGAHLLLHLGEGQFDVVLPLLAALPAGRQAGQRALRGCRGGRVGFAARRPAGVPTSNGRPGPGASEPGGRQLL